MVPRRRRQPCRRCHLGGPFPGQSENKGRGWLVSGLVCLRPSSSRAALTEVYRQAVSSSGYRRPARLGGFRQRAPRAYGILTAPLTGPRGWRRTSIRCSRDRERGGWICGSADRLAGARHGPPCPQNVRHASGLADLGLDLEPVGVEFRKRPVNRAFRSAAGSRDDRVHDYEFRWGCPLRRWWTPLKRVAVPLGSAGAKR